MQQFIIVLVASALVGAQADFSSCLRDYCMTLKNGTTPPAPPDPVVMKTAMESLRYNFDTCILPFSFGSTLPDCPFPATNHFMMKCSDMTKPPTYKCFSFPVNESLACGVLLDSVVTPVNAARQDPMCIGATAARKIIKM